jgi:hypothetical protein
MSPMKSRLVVFGSMLGLVLATSAMAVSDHLQCYKVKDTAIVLKGTVDLTDQLSGLLSPCKISSPKLYCRGSAKSNPNVVNITTPIVPLNYTGVEVGSDQDRLCYKVSCPNIVVVPTQTVTDQFGTHTLTKPKTGMVCTPANIGTSYCGDGNVDPNEQCDSGLGGNSCVTVGYGSGTLACGPGCRWDVSGCIAGAFPATGQTTCYQTAGGGVIACPGTGQDGEKQAGANLSYQDNGDGTVTDLNTGLMWEKQTDDGSINDRDQAFTFANAPTHIAALNGATFAGYTDWRLPNIRELQSLVNFGVANPAITSSAFHTNCFGGCTIANCSCTAFAHHWSSTTATNLSTAAFTVNFTDGTMGVFTKNGVNAFAVRGVRGGPQ